MTFLKGSIRFLSIPFLLLAAYAAYAETLTISTYYPSPFGSYQRLETTNEVFLATTAGNVGIGATTASRKLHVTDSASEQQLMLSSGGAETGVLLENTATAAQWSLQVEGNPSNVAAGSFFIQDENSGNIRMLIDPNNGNIGIGTVAPSERLDVDGSINVQNSLFVTGDMGLGVAAPTEKLDVLGGIHVSGNIMADGTITAASDLRFKQNIQEMDPVLPKLDQLRPVTYERSPLGGVGPRPGEKEIGVIGQELEAVFPELVLRSGAEQYRSVDYSRLSVVLLEAVKELKTETQRLKQQQKDSDARIQELEERLRENS